MATKKVRVLRAVDIEGLSYRADDVLVLEADLAKTHEADGAVDSNAAAVGYCEKELNAKAIDHGGRIAKKRADEKAAAEAAAKQAG